MKIEAITLREIQMPLVHFFETSFGRTYSRRILLLTIHSEGVDGWGESVVGEDPFYSSEWIESAWPTLTPRTSIPMLLRQEHRVRARLSCAIRKSSRASHGKSGPRKCSLGDGGDSEAAAALEVAGWLASRNSMRRLDRHPGFRRAASRENRDRTGCRISSHQSEGQTRMGRQRSGAQVDVVSTSPSVATQTPPTHSTKWNTCGSSISSTC